MEDSRIRQLIRQLVDETIAEMANTGNDAFNEQGTVVDINSDGTVNVQTNSGVYSGVGTPVTRVTGEQVLVVTANGQKVAI